jgi:predicted dehydrogenase
MGAERAAALHQLGAHIVCFCDTDSERAQTLAQKFGAIVVSADQLSLQSLDAVFVCVPPAYRGPIESQCLASGTALFVEKPIGLTANQVLPLLEQLNRRHVIHAVGYMNRYRNSVRLARKVLDGHKVLGITCAWVGRKYLVPWWMDTELSGGPFNEQATHVVDLCRLLVGEIDPAIPAAVQATGLRNCEFSVAVALRFVSGSLGTIFYTCEAKAKDIRMQLFCEDGTLGFEGWDFVLTRNTVNGKLPEQEEEEIFIKETRAFLDAVRYSDQSLIECDLAEAFRTQQVVDAVRTCFRAGLRA